MTRTGAPRKILLLESLTPVSMGLGLTCRLFGFDVVYLYRSDFARKGFLRGVLERAGIRPADFGELSDLDRNEFLSNKYVFARKIYSRLFSEVDIESLVPVFDGGDKRKIEVCLVDAILGFVANQTALLFYYAYCIRDDYDAVYIHSSRVFPMHFILDEIGYVRDNIHPMPFLPFEGLLFAARLLLGKAAAAANRRGTVGRTEGGEAPARGRHDLLFFPHQGVAYGSLFMKGYYYSDDPASERHPSNILHVEYDLEESALRERIVRHYQDRSIPYAILPCVHALRAARQLGDYFRRRGIRALRVSSLKDIAREAFVMLTFGRYKAYHELMTPFKSAKLALVGYDFLFPKPLSLALSAWGIKTVSMQERFLSTIPNITSVLLDHYFVWGKINQEGLEKDPNSHVSSVSPAGPPRLDLFFDRMSKRNAAPGDPGRSKTIVALDYLSFEDPDEDRLSPHVNWKNNMVFYRDILRLASDLPGVKIILRGKNDSWCRMPYFQEIYRSMQALPNLSVDHDYGEFNVSYELAAGADLVIGKYTSLLDEALAAGKPVLIHDYSKTMSKETCAVFDYKGLDIFVFSYDRLKERAEKILFKDEYVDPRGLRACRGYFYGGTFDGRILERVNSEIDRLLRERDPYRGVKAHG